MGLIRRRPIAVFFVALVLRLILAIATQGNYDLRSYEIVRGIVLRSGNVYAETHRYNYSSAWSLVIGALPDPVHISARVFLSAVDVLNGLILGMIAGAKARTAYLLNPAAILLVGYGGQFETLALLPLLLALRFPRLTWLLGTAAVIIKHDTVFLAWLLYVYHYRGWRAWLAMLGTGLAFLATFIPYLPDGTGGILRNALLYQGITGVYGIGALLPGAFVLFLLGMIAAPYLAKRMGLPLREALVFAVVVQFALMPSMGDTYWVIPLVIGALVITRWYWVFTAVALVVTLVLPWSVTAEWVNRWPYELRLMNIVWIVLLAWLASYFVAWKRFEFTA